VIVVDTNILVYFFVPGDITPDAESAYERDNVWAAPLLWRPEIRNVLATYMRRGLFTLEQALATFDKAEALMESHTCDVESRRVLELAHSSGCSAYDCEFVALAQELGVPLVTSDRKLAAKFKRTAISLREYVRSARP
jgi:predicted nucleic acid-binding protein